MAIPPRSRLRVYTRRPGMGHGVAQGVGIGIGCTVAIVVLGLLVLGLLAMPWVVK